MTYFVHLASSQYTINDFRTYLEDHVVAATLFIVHFSIVTLYIVVPVVSAVDVVIIADAIDFKVASNSRYGKHKKTLERYNEGLIRLL